MTTCNIIPSFVKKINEINYLDRIKKIRLMPENVYKTLYTNLLIPTNIKFDLTLFKITMEKYNSYFKIWSDNRKDIMHLRYGLPLVNVDGKYDNFFDCTIGPLDYHNKCNPGNELWETDITTPTEILNEPCFSVLDPIKPYLLRSSILKWHPGANFLPHYDTVIPSPWFRFWGTNDPESIKLRFQRNNSKEIENLYYEECKNIEPGRLYLIDTAHIHDAMCIKNTAFQFFISVNNDCYETAMKLKL